MRFTWVVLLGWFAFLIVLHEHEAGRILLDDAGESSEAAAGDSPHDAIELTHLDAPRWFIDAAEPGPPEERVPEGEQESSLATLPAGIATPLPPTAGWLSLQHASAGTGDEATRRRFKPPRA